VNGTNAVGGLVGEFVNGTLDQIYASAAVTATGSYTGGLLGILSAGTISNVYATGTIGGTSHVGGLIGYQSGGNVAQAYAIGAVTGANKGGLIGVQNGGSVTASVWDTLTTGMLAGRGLGLAGTFTASGFTTSQLQDFATYTTTYSGWNFTTIWSPPNQAGQNGNPTAKYPTLVAVP
jgi:hypothetical protein